MKLIKDYIKYVTGIILTLIILMVLAAPVRPAAAQTTYTIIAKACTGGDISPVGEITVNAGDNLTFTITPDAGKQIQDVWIDKTTSLGPVTSYTFENIQAAHFIAVSFKPYSLEIVAGSAKKTLSPSQFQALPGYGSTCTDNNGIWKGVPLYILVNQMYPGDSTTYSVSAITSDPTYNDIPNSEIPELTNCDQYPFLEPGTRDSFIVADQYSKDGGSNWLPIPPTASGAGGWIWAPLRLIGPPQAGATSGTAFRHYGAGLLKLEIGNLEPWITTQPSNKTVSAGSTASFTAVAGGDPAPTVQWQVSTDSGSTWNDISGAAGTTLKLTGITLDQSGTQYQAIFTNDLGEATSDSATLTVNPAGGGGGGGGGGGSINTNTTITTHLFGGTSSLTLNVNGVVKEQFTASSADGTMSLTIPAGTVAKDAAGKPISALTESVNADPPALPSGTGIIGSAFNFEPSGVTFNPPISFTYHYDPSQLPEGVAETDLVLAYFDSQTGSWVNLPTTVDSVNHILKVSLSHFTTFAITAILPAKFTCTLKDISPQEIVTGETVNITASISNTGGKEGDFLAELLINGVKEQGQSVKVGAGESAVFTFTVSKTQPGDYTVNIGGAEGKFTVVSPATFALSNLSIQPALVQPGETVTVSIAVFNTGGREGICPVDLLVNSTKESSRNVTVPANDSQTVVFELTRIAVGDYSITIDKSSGSFTVEVPAITTTIAPASTPNSEETEGQPLNWTLIGIIAVITVVVLLFVILLIRKKRLY